MREKLNQAGFYNQNQRDPAGRAVEVGLESIWGRKANEIQGFRVLQACSLPPWPPSRPMKRDLQRRSGRRLRLKPRQQRPRVPDSARPSARLWRGRRLGSGHLVRRALRSPAEHGSLSNPAAASRSWETYVVRPNDRELRGRRGHQAAGPGGALG